VRVPRWTGLAALAALILLYLPLVAVAWRSVNAAGARESNAWKGFTLRWYQEMFANEAIADAAMRSLIVATVSTVIATIAGTLLAISLAKAPWPRWLRKGSDLALTVPVVTPDIVIGIALITGFVILRQFSPVFETGMTTMVIAHVTFEIAFVTLVVRSRLALIGKEQWEAARDLYCSTAGLWWRVILPQLWPGILAGAGLAFILSVDDFMVSFFVSGPGSTTLPIHIYGQMRMGLSPTVHALSTAVIAATLAVLLIIALVPRRTTLRSTP
jgi:spermidine/putrescine transport system permease protein